MPSESVPQCEYTVAVRVRLRGATGHFYPQTHYVVAGENADRDEIFSRWQEKYSEQWEPYSMTGFQKSPPREGSHDAADVPQVQPGSPPV